MDLEVQLAHLEEREKSNTKRLDEHDDKFKKHDEEIAELKETNAILKNMNYRMEKMETSVEKIDKKLDEKVQEDNKVKGKKWDKLVDYLFYFVLALLLGYIAVNLGLK